MSFKALRLVEIMKGVSRDGGEEKVQGQSPRVTGTMCKRDRNDP